ncbi:MAG TPA: hypothetical protein PLR44_13885 [Thermomicrobiales bacterium]|jgi:hypothetical protein|nr:hypothetical protein [Thermomicrobiales bacterium]
MNARRPVQSSIERHDVQVVSRERSRGEQRVGEAEVVLQITRSV